MLAHGSAGRLGHSLDAWRSWCLSGNSGSDLAERSRGVATGTAATEAAVVNIVLRVAAGALPRQRLASAGAVAAGTARALMGAAEGKCGTAMVEIPDLPVPCDVTASAVRAVAAGMGIVLAVTAAAGAVGIGKQLGAMAVAAGHLPMAADQRKAAQIVVVGGGLPVLFPMAVAALPAESGLMDVVVHMTVDTLAAGLGRRHRFYVAGLASGLAMAAAQGECSSPVVVKQTGLPVAGIVTVAALKAVATLMAVILAVAIDALHAGVTEVGGIHVAGLAVAAQMPANQGKARA